MKINILLPIHNEEKNIERCLKSVFMASIPKGVDISVFTILNGCTDKSEEIVKRISLKKNNLHVQSYSWSGKTRAMNMAIKTLSKDSICVIIDTDTTISSNFIERTHEAFLKDNIHVLGADYVPSFREEKTHLALYEKFEHAIRLANPSSIPIGRFIAFKKEDIPILPEGIHSDDNYITYNLWKRFGKDSIFIDKEIKSSYYPTTTWSELIKQRTRWVHGDIQLLNKFPELGLVVEEKKQITRNARKALLKAKDFFAKKNNLPENIMESFMFIKFQMIPENANSTPLMITEEGTYEANITTK